MNPRCVQNCNLLRNYSLHQRDCDIKLVTIGLVAKRSYSNAISHTTQMLYDTREQSFAQVVKVEIALQQMLRSATLSFV